MTMKNKTILVTGGAGFIGSHFAQTAAKTNDVTVFDNFASSVVTPAELTSFGVKKVITGDILDEKKINKAMTGIDIVFHFAVACVRLSLSRERYVHDINTTGTLNTLVAAKNAHVKRFVYISSSEVYGSAQGALIDEKHPLKPTTVYGMSKYIGELYTKQFNDLFNLPTIIVRPFNSYGPRSHFEDVYGEVIPRFVIRALNGKQPMIFGTGRQTRDFTYVTDTVAGIMLASQSDKLLGESVNIAFGREVSVHEIARTVCQEVGLPFTPIMKQERPNDVARHAASIKKAQKLLGYKPQVEIVDGLNTYISWMKKTFSNPKRLMKLVPDTNW
jgi:UDP-glucose 4-epimerase